MGAVSSKGPPGQDRQETPGERELGQPEAVFHDARGVGQARLPDREGEASHDEDDSHEERRGAALGACGAREGPWT